MANPNNNDKKIDDIVSMIDSFMSDNGGHINVSVDSTGEATTDKSVTTTNFLECAGNMACQVPTLHNGLDDGDNSSDN